MTTQRERSERKTPLARKQAQQLAHERRIRESIKRSAARGVQQHTVITLDEQRYAGKTPLVSTPRRVHPDVTEHIHAACQHRNSDTRCSVPTGKRRLAPVARDGFTDLGAKDFNWDARVIHGGAMPDKAGTWYVAVK